MKKAKLALTSSETNRELPQNFEYSTNFSKSILAAEAISHQMKGFVLAAKNRNLGARAEFNQAVELFDQIPFYDEVAYMPPEPPHESLGDALFRENEFDAAIREYQKSLEMSPNRSTTLLKLARAAKKASHPELCQQVTARLAKNWDQSDMSVQKKLEEFSCEMSVEKSH